MMRASSGHILTKSEGMGVTVLDTDVNVLIQKGSSILISF